MTRFVCMMLLATTMIVPASAATVAPELPALLAQGPRPVWVFFTDKGALEDDSTALATSTAHLTERALARRTRTLGSAHAVAWIDLPNDPTYLEWLRDHDLEIRAESRWLAAVSVVADTEALALLAAAPFVARLEPVSGADPRHLPVTPAVTTERTDKDLPLDYGDSEPALSQINVPAVHELGFHGEGVVIGMLDTGFNTTHEALIGLEVLGTWDFVNDDPIVANEPGDPEAQENHGTMTLSAIAGFKPGSLVGPAFAASFYLAKTEDISQEVPAEEDYWVEGIEWLEAQGCDLVSSSLVYDDWYTFEDFDGNTCTTTIAADLASDLGMAVFNSAGNYRESTGTIGAPADGNNVIAVGAVGITGEITSFSSPGPTADGRIKPDLCALGSGNFVVVPGTFDEYRTVSGTSLSCPLAAGVGALLLGAHPGTGPWELREAMRSTASQAGMPDNDYGWGIIDALAALGALDVTTVPGDAVAMAPLRFEGNWPNPFNPRTHLSFSLAHAMNVDLDVLDLRGRLVRRLQSGRLAVGEHTVVWDGRDERGRAVGSGVYVARISGAGTNQRRKLVLLK